MNTYYIRREQGLCVSCGGTRDTKRITCSPCLEKNRKRNSASYAKFGHTTKAARRAAGLCPYCGDKPEDGKTFCRPCLNKRNELVKGRAKRNARNGLCVCGEKPSPGYAICDTCMIRGREKQDKRKSLGLCTRCKKTAASGSTMCDPCREGNRERSRNYHAANKTKVFDHYGRMCRCCGETESDFLSIDHINGGGSQQRKRKEVGEGDFYGWIVRNGFPTDLRVLCMNCNFGRRKTGVCPHERARQDASAETNAGGLL